MAMDKILILQLNCQRAYSVICELGQAMCNLDATFALVQEPYTSGGHIRGLPGGMRVFLDGGGNSAVIVRDKDVDCTVVSCSQWGVCVSVEGGFGRMLLASIYCRFREPLEPYLSYMDSVLLLASSYPVIFGLDANACSRMWFSKMGRSAPAYQNYVRGVMLSEWLVTKFEDAMETLQLPTVQL